MTTHQKYTIASPQLPGSKSDEWATIDDQYVADMLDYNIVEKAHNFHDDLAIHTKVDSVVGYLSPEPTTTESGDSDIKIEDDDNSASRANGHRVPTTEDECMTNHAEDLRKALNATVMAEDEDEIQDTSIKQEEPVEPVESSDELEPFPNLDSPAPNNSHSSTPHPPKTLLDGCTYLEKIQTRFSSQPGVYHAFLEILKAYRATPSPSPVQQTHDLVRKLFWPHRDLIGGFEEWLPKPVVRNLALRAMAVEVRVGVLEREVWGLKRDAGSGGWEARGRDEREVGGLKGMDGMVGCENHALRERMGQLDFGEAGLRRDVEHLDNEAEVVEGENEMMEMEMEVDGCKE
ncbi:hypothetical protein FKW77_008559 [Venturia effusa]|uniref:Histone deacetylase interacting domain-containing protein n=1 Tax=Venturia effusa TaxID=50376 RepID=A0A517L5Z4_9PEZI|nr:hypothetical protein FKW77_008559 [Venturia effusa]